MAEPREAVLPDGSPPGVRPNGTSGANDEFSPLAIARRVVPAVESFVVQHPVAGLAAALAAGICLGWLIKRR